MTKRWKKNIHQELCLRSIFNQEMLFSIIAICTKSDINLSLYSVFCKCKIISCYFSYMCCYRHVLNNPEQKPTFQVDYSKTLSPAQNIVQARKYPMFEISAELDGVKSFQTRWKETSNILISNPSWPSWTFPTLNQQANYDFQGDIF